MVMEQGGGFDYSKIIVPISSFEKDCGQRIRELIAQNQSQEQITAGITLDLCHLGSNVGTSYQNSKKFHKLVKQAIALKNHMEKHMDHNNPDSKKLLNTLQKIISVVTRYRKDIRDLPFDWVRELFLPSVLRGWKISYPAGSRAGLMGITPEFIDVPSDDDDDDCESVNGSKAVEAPLKDPLCSRISTFNLATPGSLVAHIQDEAWLYMTYSVDENEDNLPYAEEDKIWLELEEFDKGNRKSEGTNSKFDDGEIKSIGVDHPIVSAVGNFVVAAFNKACKKHVKKGEDNNLHSFEFMECKYLKVDKRYHFYMIIEAIEEGNPGTYMAEVTCNSTNGAKLLCKFFLTDLKPWGMKAMAASYFYCLESICKTMDDLYKEKRARLKELRQHANVFEQPTAASELCRLKRLHVKLREVLLLRCESARLRCPPDFNRMTKPDSWRDPGDHSCSGMVRRAKGTSCSGYDYCNPYLNG